MMAFTLPRIYPITDRPISGSDHLTQIRSMAAGGATLIQLREKFLPSDEFFSEAQEAAEFARAEGLTLIINDRVDIALASGASGVHLGQEDLNAAAARRLMGDDAVIGISTHNLAQAAEAARLPVDYIAIGPVFQTATKTDPDPVVGLEGVSAAKEAVGDIPLVAIGGISLANFRDVLAAGADSVAVIGAVLEHPEGISRAVSEFLSQIGDE